MHQAGPFNPAFGTGKFRLKDLKSISYNLEVPGLVEDAIRRDAATESSVWRDNNKSLTPQAFDTLYAGLLALARGMELRSGSLWRRLVRPHYKVH